MLHGVGTDWQMENHRSRPSTRRQEVLVKTMLAGVRYLTTTSATGDSVPDENLRALVEAAGRCRPEWFPLLAAEGAGIVEQVGPGVTSLHPGDHVAVSFIPVCGTCRWCVTGATYLCDIGAKLFSKNMITDDTDDTPAGHDAGRDVRIRRGSHQDRRIRFPVGGRPSISAAVRPGDTGSVVWNRRRRHERVGRSGCRREVRHRRRSGRLQTRRRNRRRPHTVAEAGAVFTLVQDPPTVSWLTR